MTRAGALGRWEDIFHRGRGCKVATWIVFFSDLHLLSIIAYDLLYTPVPLDINILHVENIWTLHSPCRVTFLIANLATYFLLAVYLVWS